MEPAGRTRASLLRPHLVPTFDTLAAIAHRPAAIEYAVRTALVEAMKWRLGGGAPPAENAFAYAAVAAVRQARWAPDSASQRAATARTAATAAVRFFRSPLGKRLMSVPAARLVGTGVTDEGADVALRDSAQRLHLVALTMLVRPLDINARAREVYEATLIAPRDRLAPVRLHLYSLATGVRHESGDRLARSERAIARSA